MALMSSQVELATVGFDTVTLRVARAASYFAVCATEMVMVELPAEAPESITVLPLADAVATPGALELADTAPSLLVVTAICLLPPMVKVWLLEGLIERVGVFRLTFTPTTALASA